jgi:hypothetical protein
MHAQSLAQSGIYLQIWANRENFGTKFLLFSVGLGALWIERSFRAFVYGQAIAWEIILAYSGFKLGKMTRLRWNSNQWC